MRKPGALLAVSAALVLPALPVRVQGDAPPRLRLGPAARPVRYALELTILPDKDTFTGVIDIDVELREAVPVIWLNASRLTVDEATVSAAERTLTARVVPGGDDFLGLGLPQPVGPGPARVHVAYRGELSRTDNAGLFKQKDADAWYVFSQFESTDARRAFPCFDEPGFKVPWRLTLRVPKDDVAVSNTPVVSEVDAGAGLKVVRFAETKPLPSYLVALGVGPFEFVDAGRAGRNRTPLRIVVPRGRSARARHVVETTPQILEVLEGYFGIPYPYEKLDALVVPTVQFGAMENAGLITYVESLILASPPEETVRFKRSWASVAAHEMAHQWFGDLVTMAWWDDVWLNEAFATWMSQKVLMKWKPEWETEASRAAGRAQVMGNDMLVTARRIRQPIESKDDIHNAFDGITYTKGASVLSMFETWLGEEPFRAGVRRYLNAHAYGSATSTDFLQALEAESRPGVAKAFSTFLDQAGVPAVSVELRCGSQAAPRLAVAQKRFLPIGSTGSAEQAWDIPICVRYPSGSGERRRCELMSGRDLELVLPEAADCPDHVLANDGETGYYLALYRGGLLARLLEGDGRRLALPERVGVLWDVHMLSEGGAPSRAEALGLVPAFAKDPSRHVLAAAAAIARGVSANLVPEDLRPRYARFVRESFGERARALGLQPRPGEDDETRLLRQTVVALVAVEGEDQELQAEAGRRARQWLADHESVDADMVQTVVMMAARSGDRDLFERFLAEAKRTPERRDRQRLLSALGSFRDAALQGEALRLLLSDAFDAREALGVLFAGLREPASRQRTYDFVKQNFDAIVARLPRDFGANLPYVASAFCDEEHHADVDAFFKDRAPGFTGGPRNLAQVLEGISLCAANRAEQEPAVRTFLARY